MDTLLWIHCFAYHGRAGTPDLFLGLMHFGVLLKLVFVSSVFTIGYVCTCSKAEPA
jgi:hypothetical protein